jgi:hypothetical protein
MNYHTFVEDGHFCPKCKAGPFLCFMEDGQCDNAGTCDECIKLVLAEVWEAMDDPDGETAYRMEMQAQYDDEWSRHQ